MGNAGTGRGRAGELEERISTRRSRQQPPRSSRLFAGARILNDPGAPPPGEICLHPLQEDDHAVLVLHEIEDVDEGPGELGDGAGKPERAGFQERIVAGGRCENALVQICEGWDIETLVQ